MGAGADGAGAEGAGVVGAVGAGADDDAGTASSTEPPRPALLEDMSARSSEVAMKIAADHVVSRESNVAAPRAPNAVWLPPPPNALARISCVRVSRRTRNHCRQPAPWNHSSSCGPAGLSRRKTNAAHAACGVPELNHKGDHGTDEGHEDARSSRGDTRRTARSC